MTPSLFCLFVYYFWTLSFERDFVFKLNALYFNLPDIQRAVVLKVRYLNLLLSCPFPLG